MHTSGLSIAILLQTQIIKWQLMSLFINVALVHRFQQNMEQTNYHLASLRLIILSNTYFDRCEINSLFSIYRIVSYKVLYNLYHYEEEFDYYIVGINLINTTLQQGMRKLSFINNY